MGVGDLVVVAPGLLRSVIAPVEPLILEEPASEA
jgi:hypothetical protein